MFEKEDFEKYMKDSKDYYDDREPMTERKLYQLWKDGAEFGYNKAKEEMQAQIEKMKEVISELIAITDKDICKDCDGGIHCSECYVNHA